MVNLVPESRCRSVARFLCYLASRRCCSRKREKNARYKKGTKPEKREPVFGPAVRRVLIIASIQQCYQEGLPGRGRPYLLQRKHCSVKVMSLSLDGLDSCSIRWLVGHSGND